MPQYTFKCAQCGSVEELTLRMADSDKRQACKICAFTMDRDLAADLPFASGGKRYAKPIHSDSMAIHPDQVKEHQRLFPDVKLDSECRPILESYKQHDAYLKKTGFVKHPQKCRKKRGKTFKQGVAK